MTDRKFYSRKITVEFLSETPFPDMGLGNMVNEAMNGDYSMNISRESDSELNGKQAAIALVRHGSDPGFFSITRTGNDAI